MASSSLFYELKIAAPKFLLFYNMAANICFSLFISSSLFHFHFYFFFPLLPLPAHFSYTLSLLHSVYYVLNTHFHFPIFSQILYMFICVYIVFAVIVIIIIMGFSFTFLYSFHSLNDRLTRMKKNKNYNNFPNLI